MQSFLFVALFAVGDVPLKLPNEVKGKPGMLVVRAETTGAKVRWVLLDPGPQLLPPELLKDQFVAVVFAFQPGKYRLLAYTGKGDDISEPAICTLVIEGEVPPPPDPAPPPGPPDPLAAKFQASYSLDTAAPALKAQQLANLIGLYQAMAAHTRDDKTLATLGDVIGDLQRTAKTLITLPDVLLELRKQIAAEVAVQIGTSPALALDASLRARAVDTFTRIAESLGRVK